MRGLVLAWLLGSLVVGSFAQTTEFPGSAWDLLQKGNLSEAEDLARVALLSDPTQLDAMEILGTTALYSSLTTRPDETIYHPTVDVAARTTAPSLKGIRAAESWWKQVLALAPARAYLAEDLSVLFFEAGSFRAALDWAKIAAARPEATTATLKRTAYLVGLAADWQTMVGLLLRLGGDREAALYRALEAWRTNGSTWQQLLRTYQKTSGPAQAGDKLAAWMLGDQMRDSEAGLQNLLTVEPGFFNLLIKQKYGERYPDQFTARLDLARNLAQYGNYERAIDIYLDLEKRKSAKTPDEKAALAFNAAWAWEAAGRATEAGNAWRALTTAKDFYARSAAFWFLGRTALEDGDETEAKKWWTEIANEPARSKYASWAALELSKLSKTE